jgi:regulation of enolase protein 1 (concanavalin A-like superfamily)
MLLEENFDRQNLNPKLSWFCEPSEWNIENGSLVIATDTETDFWKRTHYGFQVDNGHFLYVEIAHDFVLETEVNYHFVNQYDQAGLMVRNSGDCWMKTGIEYEPGEPNKLGAVVTSHGYSDWSTQDVGDSMTNLKLRVIRKGDDYITQYFNDDRKEWTQLRMFHLEEDSLVKAGIYCCSPKSAGFVARFNYLTIQ